MGKTAIFPICLTEGSSLKAEWYAYGVSPGLSSSLVRVTCNRLLGWTYRHGESLGDSRMRLEWRISSVSGCAWVTSAVRHHISNLLNPPLPLTSYKVSTCKSRLAFSTLTDRVHHLLIYCSVNPNDILIKSRSHGHRRSYEIEWNRTEWDSTMASPWGDEIFRKRSVQFPARIHPSPHLSFLKCLLVDLGVGGGMRPRTRN